MSSDLKSVVFRNEREASWRELEKLLAEIDAKGAARIDPESLYRLPTLYRTALSSLSLAREISLDSNLVQYLEGLAKRAYIQVYSADRDYVGSLLRFFHSTFPKQVWLARRFVLVAILCLVGGVVAGYQMTRDDLDLYYTFMPAESAQGRGPLSTPEELEEVLRSDGEGGSLALFASTLFANNSQVSLNAFASGFAGGAPSALLLFFNGLLLGTFLALHAEKELALEVSAWLAPHGITELLAACLAGAGGLLIGSAILFPGSLRRIESLALHGRRATILFAGSLVMTGIAALFEGFFRQLVTDDGIRITVATATAVFWIAYLIVWGRRVAEGE